MTYPEPGEVSADLVLEVTDLVKSYGTVPALKGIDLRLASQDCLGFVGPNGAGKTTFFKSVMGLLKLQEGTATILGKRVIDKGKNQPSMRTMRSQIGYAPETLQMYPFLTVEEYFRFLGKFFGLTLENLHERVTYLIEYFELDPYRTSLIGKLSRGNHQKVNLASIFLHQPRILLLDEPFTGLDISVRNKAKKLLESYVTMGIPELGIKKAGTIIISSHILADIEDLCNRVTLISLGKIIWGGLMSEIRGELIQGKMLEDLILELWEGVND